MPGPGGQVVTQPDYLGNSLRGLSRTLGGIGDRRQQLMLQQQMMRFQQQQAEAEEARFAQKMNQQNLDRTQRATLHGKGLEASALQAQLGQEATNRRRREDSDAAAIRRDETTITQQDAATLAFERRTATNYLDFEQSIALNKIQTDNAREARHENARIQLMVSRAGQAPSNIAKEVRAARKEAEDEYAEYDRDLKRYDIGEKEVYGRDADGNLDPHPRDMTAVDYKNYEVTLGRIEFWKKQLEKIYSADTEATLPVKNDALGTLAKWWYESLGIEKRNVDIKMAERGYTIEEIYLRLNPIGSSGTVMKPPVLQTPPSANAPRRPQLSPITPPGPRRLRRPSGPPQQPRRNIAPDTSPLY